MNMFYVKGFLQRVRTSGEYAFITVSADKQYLPICVFDPVMARQLATQSEGVFIVVVGTIRNRKNSKGIYETSFIADYIKVEQRKNYQVEKVLPPQQQETTNETTHDLPF